MEGIIFCLRSEVMHDVLLSEVRKPQASPVLCEMTDVQESILTIHPSPETPRELEKIRLTLEMPCSTTAPFTHDRSLSVVERNLGFQWIFHVPGLLQDPLHPLRIPGALQGSGITTATTTTQTIG